MGINIDETTIFSFQKKTKMKESTLLNSLILFVLLGGNAVHAQVDASVCIANGYDCCWAIRIWQLMGKTTSADPNDERSCCTNDFDVFTSIGIGCDGSSPAKVTQM